MSFHKTHIASLSQKGKHDDEDVYVVGRASPNEQADLLSGRGARRNIETTVSCVLLRHAQGNVLFDTGCHPDVTADPETRLGSLAKYMNPIMSADDHVLTSLKAVGLGPDDIGGCWFALTCIRIIAGNEFFRKATIFVHALEIEAANAPDALDRGHIRVDWDHRNSAAGHRPPDGCVRRRKITLIPLPGHSKERPALVKLDRSGEFLLASITERPCQS